MTDLAPHSARRTGITSSRPLADSQEAATGAGPVLVTNKASAGIGPAMSSARLGISKLPRRARIAAVVAAVVVAAVVLAVSLAAVSGLTNPERRIEVALTSLLARNPSADLANAVEIASALGIATAPADVTFTTKELRLTPLNGGRSNYSAAWTIEARRGAVVLDTATNTLSLSQVSSGSSAGTWYAAPLPKDAFDLKLLIGRVSTAAQAAALIKDANAANAKFGSAGTVRLDSTVASDPAGALQLTTTIDPGLFASCPPRIESTGEAASIESFFYRTGDQRLPMGSEIRKPAVTGVEVRGGLTEQGLLEQANTAIAEFARAKAAENLPAAQTLLAGASGLTVSGLQASTLDTERAARVLNPDCEKQVYEVTTALRRTITLRAGAWRIDYAGQPLAILKAAGSLAYAQGPDILISSSDLTLIAGAEAQGLRPTFSFRISGGTYCTSYCTRGHSAYRLRFTSLTVNGTLLTNFARTDETFCQPGADGSLACPWPRAWPSVPVPADGIKAIVLTLSLGRDSSTGLFDPIAWQPYGTGTFTWVAPEAGSTLAPAPSASAKP